MLESYREELYHCLKCGACRLSFPVYEPICPSGAKYGFDSHYAIGRLELARAVLEGGLAITPSLMERIYTCTSCGGCDEQCLPAVGVGPLKIIEAFKAESVEKGLIPPGVRDFLKGIQIHGNPYNQPQDRRGDWADGLDLPLFKDQDYLLYIGCVGSYDERCQKSARAAATLLKKLGVSFGILGAEEVCEGHEIHRVGEWGLFEYFAEQCITLLKQKNVTRIITISPHAYNAFKNEYPRCGGNFEVLHLSELLVQDGVSNRLTELVHGPDVDSLELSMARGTVREMMRNGTIPASSKYYLKATYHDPCFLGRHNGVYDAPRRLLAGLPQTEIVEMERNREASFCCGGGGGNFFTDLIGGGPDSPSRMRVREALTTGANVLVAACPFCTRMLDDAVKAEEAEERIKVLELAELILECLPF